MALAHALDQAGNTADKVETSAEVTLAKVADGFGITEILLKTKVKSSDWYKHQTGSCFGLMNFIDDDPFKF